MVEATQPALGSTQAPGIQCLGPVIYTHASPQAAHPPPVSVSEPPPKYGFGEGPAARPLLAQQPRPVEEADEDPAEDPATHSGRILNDFANTGVMAALIGGFSLGSMQATEAYQFGRELDKGIYILNFLAVHLCTCSAITSAVLYRCANSMADPEHVVQWHGRHWMLMMLPWGKFFIGALCYLVGVVLWSYRDLEGHDFSQYACTAFGAMTATVGAGTAAYVNWTGKRAVTRLTKQKHS
eukprot:TRINITY_DN4724_c0_g1_i1.p1 TRINITY_DN4724_c0_g1~~TRINITY_DN4724_c0_g1_i1.p1  ORF type:complete len:267 (+),score=77.50 TRINITY_DN4724_c0_g1_i1:86-802(+)